MKKVTRGGLYKKPLTADELIYLTEGALTHDALKQHKKRNPKWVDCKGRFIISKFSEIVLNRYPQLQLPAQSIEEICTHLKKEKAIQKTESSEAVKDLDVLQMLHKELYEAKEAPTLDVYREIKAAYPKLRPELCVEAAQKSNVLKCLVGRSGVAHVIKHKAYVKVYPDHCNTKAGYHTLIKLLKDYTDKGYHAVIDKRWLNKVEPRALTPYQKLVLEDLYKNPKKYTIGYMHKKLVEKCAEVGETAACVGVVGNYKRDVLDKNIPLYAQRNGARAARKKLPFVTRERAYHRNTLIGYDGWVMPFWVKDERGIMKRYVLFFTMDSHSKCIIDWGVGRSETTMLILPVLENTVRIIGGLPTEWISDKHSFHTTQISGHIKAEMAKRGCTVETTTNPQTNHTERNNQYLHEIAKELPWWLGSSKNRLSEEYYKEAGKPENNYTQDGIQATALYIVDKYNNTPQTALEGLTPQQAYEQSADAKMIPVTEEEIAIIFGQQQEATIGAGQITLHRGLAKFEYQLSSEAYAEYGETKVMVRYVDLHDCIYIFNRKTDAFIECIHRKTKIPAAAADRQPHHIELLNKNAGRKKGLLSKGQKATDKAIAEAIKSNPENIHFVGEVHKDVRHMANEDIDYARALKLRGIDANMLPIKTQKVGNGTNAPVKTKQRPFAAVNNELRVLTAKELRGDDYED